MRVEFYKHNLVEDDFNEVLNTLRGTFLTTGPQTKKFETAFASYLGTQYALGFTSWTSAAFLVLKAWGIGPGDEVIVPPLTFIATANVVLHCGATPIFVDVEPQTGNMDLNKVAAAITKKTKAIIPVHLYGQMCDMKGLYSIANKQGIKILEDSAHCVEGMRDGYKVGAYSDAAAFSFYATKNLGCGEGGAVATNDSKLIESLSLLRLHGMNKSAADRYTGTYKHWDMECLGYKANMFDIQAALLVHQLDRLEAQLKRREEICQYYETRFKDSGISFPLVYKGSRSARHLFTIWAPEQKRDAMLNELQQKEIGVAVNFRAIHLLKYYKKLYGFNPGSFPVAERIGDATLTLPLYPKLTDLEVEYVVRETIKAYKKVFSTVQVVKPTSISA